MTRTAAALAIAALTLSACSGTPAATPTPTPTPARLMVAGTKCNYPNRVADNGRSFTIDTKGKSDTEGMPVELLTCMLDAIGAPQDIREHIASTRALDGQQTETWDDYDLRWTYHPDSGLKLTIVDTRVK